MNPMIAELRAAIVKDELETQARVANLQVSHRDWQGREVATRIWKLHRQRTDPLRRQLEALLKAEVTVRSMQGPEPVVVG